MKPVLALRFGLAATASIGSATLADVRLPAFFDDGMVLQQNAEARLWGWADPGERITVSPDWPGAQPASATADAHGRWMVRLRTPSAGGPHTITVRGRNELTINDVLLGEVWLCSGQSNMEMPLGNVGPGYTGVLDWEAEVAAADHPAIRLFTVANALSAKPEDDCRGAWTACTPETARTFSATAYYFGRELHRELRVPIGLIAADWGGTVCEAWMSEAAVARFPELADRLEVVRLTRDDPDRLDMVIWGPDYRLCGLGLGLTTGEAVEIRFIEGDPSPDCPLKGRRTLIILECASCYAQARGRKELRIQPINERLEDLYRQTYGFVLETPRRGERYYRKDI